MSRCRRAPAAGHPPGQDGHEGLAHRLAPAVVDAERRLLTEDASELLAVLTRLGRSGAEV